MYAAERQQRILTVARAAGRVEVAALADDLAVSPETIRRVIAQGVNNAMPALGERLGDERVRLLSAYVLSLGESR